MAEDKATQVVFEPPGPDMPGYLKLIKELSTYQSLMERIQTGKGYDPDEVDGLVDFLVRFIKEPKDRKAAKNLLWEASASQLGEMFGALLGANENQDPFDEKDGN